MRLYFHKIGEKRPLHFSRSPLVVADLASFLKSEGAEPAKELRVGVSSAGKPRVLGESGLYLSISHTGDTAVVAVSRRPVGVDAEVLRPAPLLVLRRFCASEREYVKKGGDRAFFEVWTAKEALAKLLDTPLMGVLSEIETAGADGPLPFVCGARLSRFERDGLLICVAEAKERPGR